MPDPPQLLAVHHLRARPGSGPGVVSHGRQARCVRGRGRASGARSRTRRNRAAGAEGPDRGARKRPGQRRPRARRGRSIAAGGLPRRGEMLAAKPHGPSRGGSRRECATTREFQRGSRAVGDAAASPPAGGPARCLPERGLGPLAPCGRHPQGFLRHGTLPKVQGKGRGAAAEGGTRMTFGHVTAVFLAGCPPAEPASASGDALSVAGRGCDRQRRLSRSAGASQLATGLPRPAPRGGPQQALAAGIAETHASVAVQRESGPDGPPRFLDAAK